MRGIILEESEIVEALTVQFAVTFFLPFHEFASVVRSIHKWHSPVSLKILLIIYFEFLHVLAEIGFADLVEESVAVD